MWRVLISEPACMKQLHQSRHKPASSMMGLMLLYCLAIEVLHHQKEQESGHTYVYRRMHPILHNLIPQTMRAGLIIPA